MAVDIVILDGRLRTIRMAFISAYGFEPSREEEDEFYFRNISYLADDELEFIISERGRTIYRDWLVSVAERYIIERELLDEPR